MKKVILGLFAIATLSFTTVVFAADNSSLVIVDAQEEKTEIAITDLPDAVKEGWAKSDYKTEQVEKVFKVKTASEEYIEFIVVSDQGKLAVHFDMDGKLLREKAVS